MKKKFNIPANAYSGVIYDKWVKVDCVTREYLPSDDTSVKYVISTKGTYGEDLPYIFKLYYNKKFITQWRFKTNAEALDFKNNKKVSDEISSCAFDNL